MLRRLLIAALLLCSVPAACTHPPGPVAGPTAGGGSTAGRPASGCDGPVLPDQPEACVDDSPRSPDAPVAARPGDDRDGDGVEDLLDVCPDEPARVDADEDGCPDPETPPLELASAMWWRAVPS